MKIDGSLYRDGIRCGEIIYVSAVATPDSQNPQFLTVKKATQFFLMVKTRAQKNELHGGVWEVGGEFAKKRLRILTLTRQDDQHLKLTVELD